MAEAIPDLLRQAFLSPLIVGSLLTPTNNGVILSEQLSAFNSSTFVGDAVKDIRIDVSFILNDRELLRFAQFFNQDLSMGSKEFDWGFVMAEGVSMGVSRFSPATYSVSAYGEEGWRVAATIISSSVVV